MISQVFRAFNSEHKVPKSPEGSFGDFGVISRYIAVDPLRAESPRGNFLGGHDGKQFPNEHNFDARRRTHAERRFNSRRRALDGARPCAGRNAAAEQSASPAGAEANRARGG